MQTDLSEMKAEPSPPGCNTVSVYLRLVRTTFRVGVQRRWHLYYGLQNLNATTRRLIIKRGGMSLPEMCGYKIVIGKSEGKRPHVRPRVQAYQYETGSTGNSVWACGMDSSGSIYGAVNIVLNIRDPWTVFWVAERLSGSQKGLC
jgi:hypothetical protein